MRKLRWEEFDYCVEQIVQHCSKKNFCGVYGFPRGGLCLAVALSHSLDIPFLQSPQKGSLVVDDVYETGQTLSEVSQKKDITAFVWFSKVQPQWWNAVHIIDPEEWIVFPWEDQKLAKDDQKNYWLSRR
tara:strand:+ start:755 stop:1141 length:387 start_codon:yes stop_codon:yes gene_type:complete